MAGRPAESDVPRPRVSRRQILRGAAIGAGVVGGSALAAATDPHLLARVLPAAASAVDSADPEQVVPFHGAHQPGIETSPPGLIAYHGLVLLPGADGASLRRMMRLLSDDAARLMRGEPALADLDPELAAPAGRLTVTFGFGREFVARAGGSSAVPSWLRPLPPFSIDRLTDRWGDADLLIQVAGDDPLTRLHASRVLLRDTATFARGAWTQTGFRRHDAGRRGTRNLFGQVDGTRNPQPGTEDFDRAVWISDSPRWLIGGTGLVLRRIEMDLDGWDALDRVAREASVGRSLSTGAPLTGTEETDEPDLAAVNSAGFSMIHEFAHLRRSHVDDLGTGIFRRAYNFDDQISGDGVGQLFASFQADIDRQFVPVQRRLAESDLLNEWTVPVGSAVFAVPPGCSPGGFIGETLWG